MDDDGLLSQPCNIPSKDNQDASRVLGQAETKQGPQESEEEMDDSTRKELADNSESTCEQEHEQIAFTSRNIELLNLRKPSERDRSFIPPRANCPEKIIFCLDVSSEMNAVPFKIGEGVTYTPLSMIRRILEIFIQTKHRLDKRHEFALVLLQESAAWVKDFVSDPRELVDFMEDVQETVSYDSMNLASLFDVISQKVTLPTVENNVDNPPYVIRVIMLYCRSQCIPELSATKEGHDLLRHSEYFFIDVFYIHEPPSEDNKCEEIFDVLCDLDERGTSYILEVARNPTRLHDHMAKLLAHPLQRPLQNDAQYKLLSAAQRRELLQQTQ